MIRLRSFWLVRGAAAVPSAATFLLPGHEPVRVDLVGRDLVAEVRKALGLHAVRVLGARCQLDAQHLRKRLADMQQDASVIRGER